MSIVAERRKTYVWPSHSQLLQVPPMKCAATLVSATATDLGATWQCKFYNMTPWYRLGWGLENRNKGSPFQAANITEEYTSRHQVVFTTFSVPG